MLKRTAFILILFLIADTSAHAQSRGGGGRGGRGGGGGPRPTASTPEPVAPASPPAPLNKIEFVGVVRAVDAEADRVTIAYEEVEALNWPAGTMPFAVSKPDALKDVVVGEKVRFRLESQKIVALQAF